MRIMTEFYYHRLSHEERFAGLNLLGKVFGATEARKHPALQLPAFNHKFAFEQGNHLGAFAITTSDNPDQLIACAWFYHHKDGNYEIFGVAVDPDHRGQGLGKKIIDIAASEIAKFDPSKPVEIRLQPDNEGLADFYANLGFQRPGPGSPFMHKKVAAPLQL